MRPLIVDALASGRGKRVVTRDVIGAGPRSIAGVLEDEGTKPRIATAEAILDRIIQLADFDLLLVSGMSSDLKAVRRVISAWKRDTSGPVIVGGPIASEPEIILRKTKADVCVIGEGELSLKELLEAGIKKGRLPELEKLEMIKGLAFKDEEVKVNPLRPVTARRILEEFTPSTSVITDYPHFRSSRVYVEVVRGCSNYSRAMLAADMKICDGCRRCTSGDLENRYTCPQCIPPGCGYCSVPSLYGPPRSRSTDKIVSEVKNLLSRGVRRIVLCAPDFLDYGRDLLVEPLPLTDPRHPEANYKLLEKLLSKLSYLDAFKDKQASLLIENIKGSLVTQKAADTLGRYLMETSVNIGFETGSEKHSALLGRASTPQENLEAVSRLRRAGLKPYVYFIHGLPGQSLETVTETVNTIERSVKAGATRIILYRFQPLPMSAFHDQPKAPPAVKEKLSNMIYKAAIRANKGAKKALVGRNMRVVVAERYDRDGRYHVAYPMLHGPVVLVEDAEGLEGEVKNVNIQAVVSDRMVRGRLCDAMF